MKAIVGRLHRLEDQFGSRGETEYDQRLRQRMEAAKRRIAEARECGELPPAEEGRTLTEYDQRRLEILKQAAWHAKLRANRRAKMRINAATMGAGWLPILPNNTLQEGQFRGSAAKGRT